MNCTVEGCTKPTLARGLCGMHVQRFYKYGNPLTLKETAKGIPKQWVLDHLNYQGDDCLIWPFGKSDTGYGKIIWEGRGIYVSRVMCLLIHGPAPSKKHQAAHSCGKGQLGCVNPRHVRWATRKENEADKIIHGATNRGANHPFVKLTEIDVLEIRGSSRLPPVWLAKKYGVSPAAIHNIHKGKSWKWVI